MNAGGIVHERSKLGLDVAYAFHTLTVWPSEDVSGSSASALELPREVGVTRPFVLVTFVRWGTITSTSLVWRVESGSA